MTEANPALRLPQLEHMGDATQLASKIHALIGASPLLENFNVAEIRLMSHFMQVYRASPGQEVLREGDPGDFMLLVVEGRLDVFKQDRWNAPRLIAVIDEGKSAGEMSMIDGEPRFATCVAADNAVIATLSREALARIVLEQPILGAKILMELVLMLSQRLRNTSQRLVNYLDKQRELQESLQGPGFV
jgi:CRP/FNR family cyclic AMP-dependent transcriptional regulator